MLTIKPPIELKSHRDIGTLHMDMEEKIRGNYSLMNDSIRREELLYLTSSAQDVYFAEGNTTNILTEVKNDTRQEFRIDVINNLINRMMLSSTNNFSYQDKVYITSVLNKLGITDVNSFMKQVSLLQEDRRTTSSLIRLYSENKNLLTRIFEAAAEKQREKAVDKETVTSTTVQKELCDTIYSRLGTRSIYEEVSRFTENRIAPVTEVSSRELSVSEQTVIGGALTLQQIKNEIYEGDTPVNMFHANIYEQGTEEEAVAASSSERLQAAVLLNMVDQAYSVRLSNIERNSHNWYNVAGALFEQAQNTFNRFESYRKDGGISITRIDSIAKSISEQKNEEISAINEITRHYSTSIGGTSVYREGDSLELTQRAGDTNISLDGQSYYITAEGRISTNPEEGVALESIVRETATVRETKDITEVSEDRRTSYSNENYSLRFNREGNRQTVNPVKTESSFESVTVEHPGQAERETVIFSEKDAGTAEFRRELERINERNVENLKKLNELNSHRLKVTDVRIDRKRAMTDALRAMDNPEEVVMELLKSDTSTPESIHEQMINEQITNMYSAETKAVLEAAEAQKNMTPDKLLLEHPELAERQAEGIREMEEMLRGNAVQQTAIDQAGQVPAADRELDEFTMTLLDPARRESFIRQQTIERETTLKLVHREEERLDTEELLNAIEQQRRENKITETQVVEEKNQYKQVNVENITHQVNKTTTLEQDNIEELIRQSVSHQMNKISDQVYGKIEKKLENERRRRGY